MERIHFNQEEESKVKVGISAQCGANLCVACTGQFNQVGRGVFCICGCHFKKEKEN